MNGRFFLDTNIFVYSFDRSAATKAKRSDELVAQAITTRKGAISFQVVQEFFRIALQKFKKPMTSAEAEQYFSSTLRPLLTVHSSPSLYLEALGIHEKYRLSWYDAVVVAAAIEAECAILYSEDLQHQQRFGTLQVLNPFAPGVVH